MSNAGKVEKLRTQAGERHNAGQLEEAEQLYRRILELHRTDRQARYGLGVICLQQDRAAEALVFLEPLAAEAPQDGDILSQCGRTKQALGRGDEALSDFDRALRSNPDNALALFYRGELLGELGRLAEALQSYERLLKIAPGYGEAWFRRGNILWQMERLEDAWTSFQQEVALDPGRVSPS